MAKLAEQHNITFFNHDLDVINRNIKKIQDNEPEGTRLFWMEIPYDVEKKQLGKGLVFRTTLKEETEEYETRTSKTWKYEDYELTLTAHSEDKDIKLPE